VEAACIAAGRGFFRDLVLYTVLLDAGIGVPRSRTITRRLLAQAHDCKYADEQNNYAYKLEYGTGCECRQSEAVKYSEIAAKNGNTVVMRTSGVAPTWAKEFPKAHGMRHAG
jgi:TPR repeat protein